MKKNLYRLLAIAAAVLAVLMVLSLAACSQEEQTAAPTDTPAADVSLDDAQTQAEPSPTPSPETLLPTATPVPTANAEGLLTFTSMSKGFSFQYDEKYIALSNQADNAMIYPAGDTTLPYCAVSLVTDTDAVSYLKEIADGASIELEGSMSAAPGEPADVGVEGREVYTISYSYSYEDEELSGTVVCTYYAENISEGQVAVFSSTALEKDGETVASILKTAMDTFKLD